MRRSDFRDDAHRTDVHGMHTTTDRPCLATVGFGPIRRFAAVRKDGRSLTYRVTDLGLRRYRSVSEAMRESSERCSSPPLTHNGHRVGAPHRCGQLAIDRVNVRVRRRNLRADAARR